MEKQSFKYVNQFHEQGVGVKYEGFLERTYETLSLFLRFCDFPAKESDIEKVANQMNKRRTYA